MKTKTKKNKTHLAFPPLLKRIKNKKNLDFGAQRNKL